MMRTPAPFAGLIVCIWSFGIMMRLRASRTPIRCFYMCVQVQLQREIEKWGERHENDIEEQEQMLENLKKSRAEVIRPEMIRREIRRDISPRWGSSAADVPAWPSVTDLRGMCDFMIILNRISSSYPNPYLTLNRISSSCPYP